MKTNYKLLGVLVFVGLLVIPMVAAYSWADFSKGIENMTDGLSPLLKLLIGSAHVDGTNTAAVLLMLALVFLAVYGILSPMNIFGNNQWVNAGIALIVAILGIRFLPDNFVAMLATPSSALVAIIVAGVPLIILLSLTKREMIRPYSRIIWIIFAIINLILGLYNLGITDSAVVPWVFFAFSVFALLLAFFYKIFGKAKAKIEEEKIEDSEIDMQIAKKEREIGDYIASISAKRSAGTSEGAIKTMEQKLKRMEEARDKLIAQKNNP